MPRPDEGLIHAWLDGQLTPDEAARIEQLAETDAEWGAAVAEARGLVAASSRILSALDQVPAGVIPAQRPLPVRRRLPWWTKAAAAIVLVTGGTLAVMQRASMPTGETPAIEQAAPRVPSTEQSTAAPTSPAIAAAPVQRETAPVARRELAVPPAEQSVAKAAASSPITLSNAKTSVALAPPAPAVVALAAPPPAPPAISGGTARDAVREPAVEQAPPSPVVARSYAAAPPPSANASSVRERTAREAMEPAARRAANAVGGVASSPVPNAMAVAPQAAFAPCYQVRAVDAPERTVIMRALRADGDTVRLQSALGSPTLRAWLVVHDGTGRGAMTTAMDGSGAVAVVATAVRCPAP